MNYLFEKEQKKEHTSTNKKGKYFIQLHLVKIIYRFHSIYYLFVVCVGFMCGLHACVSLSV